MNQPTRRFMNLIRKRRVSQNKDSPDDGRNPDQIESQWLKAISRGERLAKLPDGLCNLPAYIITGTSSLGSAHEYERRLSRWRNTV